MDRAVEISSTLQQDTDLDQPKQCWVCFATEDDDQNASWVKPCKCKGSAQWVHQACLQRWIDEKQKGQTTARVACPQCNTNYVIVYPRISKLLLLLDCADLIIVKTSPVLCVGILFGSVYWSAMTYGALTILQVYGHSGGLAVLESSDTLPLIVGLPLIPATFLACKMINWEEPVLRFLRKYVPKAPVIKYLLPVFNFQPDKDQAMRDLNSTPIEPEAATTRRFCGALLLPTYAVICGKVIFDSVEGNLKRALLGGAFFLATKGIIKVCHKQIRYIRQCQRTIVDFDTGQSLVLLSRLQRHIENRQIIL